MKQLATLTFLFFSIALFAQPVNDDCPGLIDLGPAPICPSPGIYNNVGATQSNIGFDNFPGCFAGGGIPQRDVWFAFTAVDTILDYRITVTGVFDSTLMVDPMSNPQIAVYRGDCVFDGMELLDCATSANGETELYIDLSGLTPGIPYYLRINDWTPSGTANEGAFRLCIEKKPPITTIDQGSSTLCAGTLCDSGGPDEDYDNNENYTFTICPSSPHNCINFTLQYYNLDVGSDAITFYDGPNANSPLLGTLSSNAFETQGGVCYSVSASSGCLTIVFKSDATSTFEGFCGTWQCTPEECEPPAVIEVNTSATPEEMVESIVAFQTQVDITSINCPQIAMGTFESPDNSDLGLKKGLLLTSGSAAAAAQPAVNFTGAFSGGGPDSDLDYFSGAATSQDACVVELEVFAATDELTFEYIFGSEEYPVFVNTGFNDIFAFLASGPGIVGDPNINNQMNVATLPDGTFVEINSVNFLTNWQYFRDNQTGQSVVYGGLTSDSLGIKKSLTARVPTIPCNTYKLKLAIADRGDTSYDSGVFISEIKGGSPNLGINYFSGIDYLVEECTSIPDQITITLDNLVSAAATYQIEVTGTATPGVDYTLNLPPALVFTTGNEVFNFPIKPITDNIIEGEETIIIRLNRDFGCGVVTVAELVINLRDNLLVEIFKDEVDTAYVCQGSCIQLKTNGAQNYFWSPPGLMSDPNVSNPIACPDSSQWVSVLGTLDICSDVDSVYLLLVDPQVQILPDSAQLAVCPGDTVTLFAQNNVDGQGLLWNSFGFPPLADPKNPLQVFVPQFSTFMQVEINIGGCSAFDDIFIQVDQLQMPQLANDTLICQNYSVDLGEDILFSGTTYEWTPNVNLSPGPDVSGPLATPDQTTTYTLVATGFLGQCKDTASVTVTVLPADVEIQNPDTAFICIGDTVALISTSTTNGVGQTWYPQDFMTQLEPGVVEVAPPVSTWYYTKLVVGACTIVDSVLVYVDSLPLLPIVPEPNKPSYCQGEEIKLISPTYEPGNFPQIDLEWINPVPGALTPDSFLNLVMIALNDYTYLRRVTVHACSRVDSIFIDVVPVAGMQVIPAIDTICPGESVQFSIEAEPGITDFTWSPPDGLSCSDCENPVASPGGTTTYNVEGEFDGCPVGASATIIVRDGPDIDPPADTDLCPGESAVLNSNVQPGTTYLWTSSDNSLNTTDPSPVVTPGQTTTYTVVAENAACQTIRDITINVGQDFTLSVSEDETVCQGEAFTFSANATQPGVTFQWVDENGVVYNQAANTVPANVSNTFYVSASNGCFIHADSVKLEVIPSIVISGVTVTELGEDSLGLVEGEEFELSVTPTPYPVPGGVYEWFIDGVLVATTNDSTSGVLIAPEVDADSIFNFAVRITNNIGCSSIRDLSELVKNNPVQLPNIFTPNNDSVNDFFKPVSIVPVVIDEFKVWNRWGQLVYDNSNGNGGWDGKQNGEDAPSDVYVYHIIWHVGESQTQVSEKGDVTLVR